MDYREIIATIEMNKLTLKKKLENENITKEEFDAIQCSIDNYDYIIELTEMNHFERGFTL